MSNEVDIDRIERTAYRASLADGMIDTFVGLSLLWIGVAWLWIDDLAGIAGVFPAVFIAPMMALRKRVMESRTGYVRFGEARRSLERRTFVMLMGLGIGTLTAGVAAFLIFRPDGGGSVFEWVLPGILAWLLALPAVAVAVALGLRRVWSYAGVLVVAGLVGMAWATNPGLPLLLAGIAISVSGVALLVRYLHANPVVSEP